MALTTINIDQENDRLCTLQKAKLSTLLAFCEAEGSTGTVRSFFGDPLDSQYKIVMAGRHSSIRFDCIFTGVADALVQYFGGAARCGLPLCLRGTSKGLVLKCRKTQDPSSLSFRDTLHVVWKHEVSGDTHMYHFKLPDLVVSKLCDYQVVQLRDVMLYSTDVSAIDDAMMILMLGGLPYHMPSLNWEVDLICSTPPSPSDEAFMMPHEFTYDINARRCRPLCDPQCRKLPIVVLKKRDAKEIQTPIYNNKKRRLFFDTEGTNKNKNNTCIQQRPATQEPPNMCALCGKRYLEYLSDNAEPVFVQCFGAKACDAYLCGSCASTNRSCERCSTMTPSTCVIERNTSCVQ
jgi:hypothetical protein